MIIIHFSSIYLNMDILYQYNLYNTYNNYNLYNLYK